MDIVDLFRVTRKRHLMLISIGTVACFAVQQEASIEQVRAILNSESVTTDEAMVIGDAFRACIEEGYATNSIKELTDSIGTEEFYTIENFAKAVDYVHERYKELEEGYAAEQKESRWYFWS